MGFPTSNPISQQPATPAGPTQNQQSYDKFQNLLQPFKDQLGLQNTNLQGYQDKSGQIGNQYAQIAQGQDPVIEAQRRAAVGQTQAALARQGVTGGAALDQVAKTNQQFDLSQLQQRQTGLQGLQGSLQQGAGFGNDILQNLLAIPGISTAFYSAQQAGRGSGGGGGGKK